MSARDFDLQPSFTVMSEQRPVLHLPDDRVLVRAAGFVPSGASMRHIQTTGTFPQLTTRPKPKGGKKGGRRGC